MTNLIRAPKTKGVFDNGIHSIPVIPGRYCREAIGVIVTTLRVAFIYE